MKPRFYIIALAIIGCGISLVALRSCEDGKTASRPAASKENPKTSLRNGTDAGVGEADTAKSGQQLPPASPNAQANVPHHPHDTAPPERWWMNLNPTIRAQMTQMPPPWLKIGNPVPARAGDDTKTIEWKRFGAIDQTKHRDIFLNSPRLPRSEPIIKRVNGDVTIKNDGPGMIVVPKPLGDSAKGTSALVNASRSLALVCSQVYDIAGQSLALESGRPVPILNYDDKRRSGIIWETWMSDTTLVGLMTEETIEEQGPVRSALYTYDVTTRELRRVLLPAPAMDAYMKGVPMIQILATAPTALFVNVGGRDGKAERDFVLLLDL